MREERLTGLALLNIHRHVVLDVDATIPKKININSFNFDNIYPLAP